MPSRPPAGPLTVNGAKAGPVVISGQKAYTEFHVVLASLFDEALSVLSDAYAPDAPKYFFLKIVLFPRPALHFAWP
jgi:hypothetical protein